MTTWADAQMDRLNAIHGENWDIWYVSRYLAGYVWCARPKGTPTATINADTVEDLEAQIKSQQGGERANGVTAG
jgi:hypothetical protein